MVDKKVNPDVPTVVMIGKTSVGKSTLINALCWQPGTEYKEIAKVAEFT